VRDEADAAVDLVFHGDGLGDVVLARLANRTLLCLSGLPQMTIQLSKELPPGNAFLKIFLLLPPRSIRRLWLGRLRRASVLREAAFQM